MAKRRVDMDRARWPDSYWWGWLNGPNNYPVTIQEQGLPPDEAAVPPGKTSRDEAVMAEFSTSAWQFVYYEPLGTGVKKTFSHKPPDLGDVDMLDDKIRDRVLDAVRERYRNIDKSVYRDRDFDKFAADVLLSVLQSVEVQDAVKEHKRRAENLRHGAMLIDDLEYEETSMETAGWELPEEERFVRYYTPPSPPPGPEPQGRGAFFVAVDASGSMYSACDEENGLDRFAVASAIVWTFIKEAEKINIGGLSHYVGIYGFDNCMYYPVPISEFPKQLPLHPLPCGNIAMVKRDFLRYWPENEFSGGMTRWMFTLPALVDDYMTFGAGDVILICDGDINADREHMWEGDVVDDLKGYKTALVQDTENPTHLMKLQKFMKERDSGTAYLFWIVPKFPPPVFECPDCGKGDIKLLNLDRAGQKLVLRCPSGHVFQEGLGQACRDSCPARGMCEDCRYFYMVLGEMFGNGSHIFQGTSVTDLRKAAYETLKDQTIRRLRRARGMGGAQIIEQPEEEEEEDY